MGLLEQLRVERVDGVDRPATGHKWVVVKSESGDVEKDYAGAGKAALEALAKESELTLTKEQADALNALAELLELDVTFKSEDAEPDADDEDSDDDADKAADDEQDEDADDEDADDDADDVEASEDADRPVTHGELADAVKNAMLAVLEEEADEVAKSRGKDKPLSKQAEGNDPAGKPRKVKKGEGMFADVIFGDTTTLGQ